jgi:hypothetical protein
MPLVDESVFKKRRAAFDEDSSSNTNNGNGTSGASNQITGLGSDIKSSISMSMPLVSGSATQQKSLIDLDDIFGLGAVSAAAPATLSHVSSATPVKSATTTSTASVDLLSDIFSSNNFMNTTPVNPPNNNAFNNSNMFPNSPALLPTNQLLNNSMAPAMNNNNFGVNSNLMPQMPNNPVMQNPASMIYASPASMAQATNSIVAFEKDGFKVCRSLFYFKFITCNLIDRLLLI